MFSIGFLDDPIVDAEPGENGRMGLIKLGTWKERFVAHLWTWSEAEYAEHWRRALRLVLSAKPSALITDMKSPSQSSHLVWWPMWRANGEIIFHNQLFFFAQHGIEGPRLNLDQLFRLIGDRVQVDKDGEQISEWKVPLSDVEEFLAV